MMDGLIAPPLDLKAIRADFPILSEKVRGKPFVFLDSGASAQKPRQVIQAMVRMMETAYANVHRGAYHMSERATEAYEAARGAVARFLNAPSEREIIFTKSSTEAINLVAHSFGRGLMKPGQAVVISEMEHHANLVPWQMLRDAHGIELRIARITDAGELDMADLEAKLADGKVGLVAVTHMSNVLGTVTPAERIARWRTRMARGCCSTAARPRCTGAWTCRRSTPISTSSPATSCTGPTGIGVLYAKAELLRAMPPFMGGGDMIAEVTLERSIWAEPPARFEAGTPPIVEAVGLHAAIDYVTAIGWPAIEAHERELTDRAMARLTRIEGLTLLGRAQDRGSVFAFALDTAHAHDVSTLLDRAGIAVRSGRHCAEPLHQRFGVESTCRASFGLYTTPEEVDYLASALEQAREFFR
jgi:cysteine desulfurase/selenocysteine lyase